MSVKKRIRIVKATRYKLTPEGEAGAQVAPSNLSTGQTNFCYRNYRPQEITGFTEPADSLGHTVSNVKFTFRAENGAEWIRKSPGLEEFGNIGRNLKSDAEPIVGSATLVPTDQGWMHSAPF